MKIKAIITSALILTSLMIYAQERPTRDTAAVSHHQRMEHIRQVKTDFIVEKLDLKGQQEQDFRALYSEYEASNDSIMRSFGNRFMRGNLTEEQARQRIYIGFDISEKLLDNKRAYADRFLKIISASQLNSMFRLEKTFGLRMMESRMQNKKP